MCDIDDKCILIFIYICDSSNFSKAAIELP